VSGSGSLAVPVSSDLRKGRLQSMVVSAPFGFVPLSDKVVCPDWLGSPDPADPSRLPPLHDVPFEDGICGTFDLELLAETPIFSRGVSDPTRPFILPDGRYAIPGTSIRGVLRNVVEIATFGRFSRVNDHRYSIRDLTEGSWLVYGSHMSGLVPSRVVGKDVPMPLVQAGWLERRSSADGETYAITPCDFAKLEYGLLNQLARDKGIRGFDPGRKQAAVDKYKAWGPNSRDVVVDVKFFRPEVVKGQNMLSRFGSVDSLGGTTEEPAPSTVAWMAFEKAAEGVLVFTGQPASWTPGQRNVKHHDFVFIPRADQTPLAVSERIFPDFEFGHSNRGQQNSLHEARNPNPEWGYWKERLGQGEAVPVFFLCEGDRLRAFGLAMMFRLPYELSIGNAVDNAGSAHRKPDGPPDFAEGLFGTVRASGSRTRPGATFALKGRVGIGHAVATDACTPLQARSAVLAGPKASYFPIYVEQPKDGRPYKTWMDRDAVPRGWKRYRPRESVWTPPQPTDGSGRPSTNDRVMSEFCPLPSGTRFKAKVDVHNLRPVELGALLWALDFGGHDQARHAVGMGRPLGYGRTGMKVTRADLRDMRDRPVDERACIAAFRAYMDEQMGGDEGAWQASPQVQELLALAIPVKDGEARYMRLKGRLNEFRDAKNSHSSLNPLTPMARDLVRGRKVTPPPPPPRRPLSGHAETLQAWFAGQGGSAREKMAAFDSEHRDKIRGLENREDAAACLTVVRKHITDNKKTRDWHAGLPAGLGLLPGQVLNGN